MYATNKRFEEMLAAAREQKFAFTANNVWAGWQIGAVLKGLEEANSDGIIQFSKGACVAAAYPLKDPVVGGQILCETVERLASKMDVRVATSTDHCQPEDWDSWIGGLLKISLERIKAGHSPLVAMHMLDASAKPLAEILDLSQECLRQCLEANISLETEIGVVAGDEDGATSSDDESDNYTSAEDMLALAERLFPMAPEGKIVGAPVFGNVHGIFAGTPVLKPEILVDGNAAVAKKFDGRVFDICFHGGSGTEKDIIRGTIEDGGVRKINFDTVYQLRTGIAALRYFSEFAGDIRQQKGKPAKKACDSRQWLLKGHTAADGSHIESAAAALTREVVKNCELTGSAGKSLGS